MCPDTPRIGTVSRRLPRPRAATARAVGTSAAERECAPEPLVYHRLPRTIHVGATFAADVSLRRELPPYRLGRGHPRSRYSSTWFRRRRPLRLASRFTRTCAKYCSPWPRWSPTTRRVLDRLGTTAARAGVHLADVSERLGGVATPDEVASVIATMVLGIRASRPTLTYTFCSGSRISFPSTLGLLRRPAFGQRVAARHLT